MFVTFAVHLVLCSNIRLRTRSRDIFNKILNSFSVAVSLSCTLSNTLCEKCPNKEFFLVRIFLYSE